MNRIHDDNNNDNNYNRLSASKLKIPKNGDRGNTYDYDINYYNFLINYNDNLRVVWTNGHFRAVGRFESAGHNSIPIRLHPKYV